MDVLVVATSFSPKRAQENDLNKTFDPKPAKRYRPQINAEYAEIKQY